MVAAPTIARRLAAGIALVAAIGLIVLQFPTLGARFAELPGDPALNRLDEPESLTEAAYERIRASRENARAWSDDPTVAKSLGLALLVQAQGGDVESGGEDRRLRQAVAELRHGLAMAPGDAPAWTQLALAHALLGEDAEAAAALDAAVATGAHYASLAPVRAQLGLIYWFDVRPETRPGLAADFRRMVRQLPGPFARVARQMGLTDLVLLALEDDEELRERFLGRQFR